MAEESRRQAAEDQLRIAAAYEAGAHASTQQPPTSQDFTFTCLPPSSS